MNEARTALIAAADAAAHAVDAARGTGGEAYREALTAYYAVLTVLATAKH